MVIATTESYFAQDYREARQKFLIAASSADACLDHYENPAKGPDKASVFCDVAHFGPRRARKVAIVVSGSHGVEGFCGSGVQVGWILSGGYRRLPPDMAVVLVHALNPWGFAWQVRTNEDHVDLNRNFVDHRHPYPANPSYEKIHALVTPDEWNGTADEALKRVFENKADLPDIDAGQYNHPDGIHFGGNAPTWSNKVLSRIVPEHAGSAESVIFIDCHTGMGAYGYGELLHDQSSASAAHRRAREIFGQTVRSTVARDAASGAGNVHGGIPSWVTRALPSADVIALTLEFGTYPVETIWPVALRNHWLAVHGKLDGPAHKPLIRAYRDMFYPDFADWRELVWRRAQMVLRQMVEGLA